MALLGMKCKHPRMNCDQWKCYKILWPIYTHSYMKLKKSTFCWVGKNSRLLLSDSLMLAFLNRLATEWSWSIFCSVMRCSYIHTCFTVCSSVASNTAAGIAIHCISTCATILTWCAGTFINVWKYIKMKENLRPVQSSDAKFKTYLLLVASINTFI